MPNARSRFRVRPISRHNAVRLGHHWTLLLSTIVALTQRCDFTQTLSSSSHRNLSTQRSWSPSTTMRMRYCEELSTLD